MAAFELLIKDSYHEVLSWLPVKVLVQFKRVSKEWCGLIYDRFFRRVQSQRTRREPISGFFLQRPNRFPEDDSSIIAYIPVEQPRAGLYRQPDFSFLPEDVKVLVSCNGLICCRSSFPSQDPSLYVCNPLSKEWIRLNGTKPDKNVSIALAFDPCKDITDRLTNFKLFRLHQVGSKSKGSSFKFHIYSSDTGSWKISKKIRCPGDYIYENNAIFVEGRLHWLTDSDEIIAYNIENLKSWLIPVPVLDLSEITDAPYFAGCIGESDDKLHYIVVCEGGIYMWSLEDYDEVEWNLKYSRSVEVIVEENMFLLSKPDYAWLVAPLAFKDEHLLLHNHNGDIYLYEIKTNKMDEVFSGYYSTGTIALPYSPSLVPLNGA